MGPGVLVTITGMLGVFAVLILFYLIILLLNRVFPYKPEA
jgi:Na+-transporting methylmalonyl-CoA/oxaloacetate decarboxylase gamma subunit